MNNAVRAAVRLGLDRGYTVLAVRTDSVDSATATSRK